MYILNQSVHFLGGGGGGDPYAPMKPNVYKELGIRPFSVFENKINFLQDSSDRKTAHRKASPKHKYAVKLRVGGFEPANPLF
jgi:hypothetical protein